MAGDSTETNERPCGASSLSSLVVCYDQGMTSLTERERQAFALHRILGYRQSVVAEMMGVTTVTVGQYVANAKRKLLGL